MGTNHLKSAYDALFELSDETPRFSPGSENLPKIQAEWEKLKWRDGGWDLVRHTLTRMKRFGQRLGSLAHSSFAPKEDVRWWFRDYVTEHYDPDRKWKHIGMKKPLLEFRRRVDNALKVQPAQETN